MRPHLLEIVVINCGGNGSNLRRLLSETGLQQVRQVDIPAGEYNRSLAINIGIHCSCAPQVMVLDSRFILQNDFLLEIPKLVAKRTFTTPQAVRRHGPPSEWLSTVEFRRDRHPHLTAVILSSAVRLEWSDSGVTEVENHWEDLVAGQESGTSCLAAAKRDLIAVEGFNSDLRLWGLENLDVQVRLKRLLNLQHVEVGELLAIHSNLPSQLTHDLLRKVWAEHFTFLTNRYWQGELRGTYSRDVGQWSDKIVTS